MAQPHEQPERDPRERRCIATGETGSPDGLIRFVLSPEGVVTPDFSAKLPGRGAWVSASRAAIEDAARRRAFSRAFKSEARAPHDLAALVEAGLAKSALSALGLARKVGDVATGFEKVRAGLEGGKFAVLVAASDGARDGRDKLARLAGETPLVAAFTGAELSRALGRDVVHAGLRPGAAAQRFLRAARRVEGFRANDAAEAGK